MNNEPFLDFESRDAITVGVIRASSVLDAVNVNKFGEMVLAYVKAHPGLKLLLSFEHVDYLSSAVLSELLRINEAIKGGNGSLRLCGLNKDILRVFEITNLDKVFVIYDNVEAGLKRFERSLQIAAEDDSWSQFEKES